MQYSENLHLNLPEDSDPLEVSKLSENFEALDGAIKETQATSGYQIGDTLTTWRTDLGENWLLCNGDTFDADECPALAAITPGMGTMAELNRKGILIQPSTTGHDTITSYATDGSIIVATIAYGGKSSLRGVYCSSDDFQTVTKLTITDLNNSYGFSKIFYANGHWILVAQNSNNTVNGIYETTDISGAWTRHPFTSMSGYVQHIEYYDGKYWAFGTYKANMMGDGWCGYFMDFNITAIPKNITVKSNETSYYMCFVRTDKFEFFDALPRNNTFYRHIADTPDGTWEKSAAIKISRAENVCPSIHAFYSDGLIYGLCVVSSGTSDNNNGIYVIDGETIKYGLFGTKYGLTTSPSVRYARDCIVAMVSNKVFVLSINTMETYVLNTNEGGLIISIGDNHIIPAKNNLIGTLNYPIVNDNSSHNVNLTKIPLYAVPEIPSPQSYTYIKAKEDTPNADQQTDAPAS